MPSAPSGRKKALEQVREKDLLQQCAAAGVGDDHS